ncbi:hypothetical protein [Aquimonas voraii]|uniref:CHC2 zinc finger n=1 Tax=Aquimonas voraii TaxID=265719 RepID=A0A1G6TTY0_9GAMM|nr:hypothetical protein [Aquimonas voraii]SDD32622.1 hypothetical protein SAMN04488509_1023 [Aquimonas voraii]
MPSALREVEAGPLELVLSRLDRPRRSGRGYLCRCPAHEDRAASLSIAAGDDGRVLLHCFAGCSVDDVVAALGLQRRDLFPPNLRRAHTPEERRAAWRASREAAWAAALGVLGREALVIEIAAGSLAAGEPLSAEDLARLRVACERVEGARAVLT